MKTVITCCLTALLATARAQEDRVLRLKIRYPPCTVVVEQEDTVLYSDHINVLRIFIRGKDRLGNVLLQGGEIAGRANRYTAVVNEGTKALLVVTKIRPDGKQELALSKLYSIVHLPGPVPMFGGVAADSIIHRDDLLKSGRMYAEMTRFGITHRLRVASFNMVAVDSASLDTLPSVSGALSADMRRRILSLRPGNPLYFERILCIMPDGSVRLLQDMRLFVDLTPKVDALRERR